MKTPASIREVILLLCGASVVFFMSGCRTAPPDPAVVAPTWHSDPTVAPSPEALTYFSMGLLDELHAEHDAATTNFLKAIEHDPENEELYWLAAERLTTQGRKQEALEIFDLLIQRKPKSQSGYLWKGWVLQTMQKQDQAELLYRKAIRIAPRHLGSYMRLAHLLVSQEQWEDAAALLEKAVRKVDEPLRPYEMLGEVYQQHEKKAADPLLAAALQDKAITTYTRALEKYADQRTFTYQLGLLHARKGNTAKALDLLTRFETFTPNNLQIKNDLINKLSKAMGGQEEAIKQLETYLGEHADNGQVCYYLAGLYELAGNDAQALHYYGRSAKLVPEESAPRWKQSLLLVQQTNLTEAVNVLHRGLETLPEDVRLGEMLAFVELQRTNFAAAVEAFGNVEQKLLQKGMSKNMQNLWMNYAIAAQQLGDLDLATRKLLSAAALRPESIPAFAQRMFRQKDQEKVLKDGIAIYTKITEQEPDNPYAHYHLGLFHSYSQHFPEAAKSFKQAEEIIQDKFTGTELLNAFFYFLYAAASERNGDIEEAEALFYECIEKDPEHAEAHNYLAYMWAENDMKLDKAMKQVDIGLALEPENGAFLDTKGWILYQQGHYAEALTYLEKANTLIPDDPTINEHVGDVLFKLDRKDEARTLWEKALLKNPENEALGKKLQEETAEELSPEPLSEAAPTNTVSEQSSSTNSAPPNVVSATSNETAEAVPPPEAVPESEANAKPALTNAVETVPDTSTNLVPAP